MAFETYGKLKAGVGNLGAKYGGGLTATSLKLGTLEAFGWHIEGFGRNATNYGFLGHRKLERSTVKGINRVAFQGLRKTAFGTLGRSLPLMSTLYFGYQGYKRGGVLGAAKEMGESALWGAAFHYVGGALSGGALSVGLPLAMVGIAGYGAYALGKAGRQHMKRLSGLELGGSQQTQDAINSAGAATMRQRSLMALNNTHLGARSALGNEAAIMHRGF